MSSIFTYSLWKNPDGRDAAQPRGGGVRRWGGRRKGRGGKRGKADTTQAGGGRVYDLRFKS